MSWIGRDMPPDDTRRNKPPVGDVECPECEGTDPECDLCLGTGWVSPATQKDMRDSGAEDYESER